MFGLKIGDDFLELAPGTQMQMELNNPLLQFGDQAIGEYSLPVGVAASPKNLKALGYIGLFQKKEEGVSINAQAFDAGLQYSVGKLKVEKTQPNLNNRNNGQISLFYLTGYASFYQDIKDLRLRNIDVGGERSFANDNFNINGSGFWGHCNTVLHGVTGYGTSGFDYAFYPVVNANFGQSTNGPDCLNLLARTGPSTFSLSLGNADLSWNNLIVPFPYLKFIIIKAVEYSGWKIEGDILNDADFCKITMINSRCINYGWKTGGTYYMYPTIKFNLADHLPDISIVEFLLWLKNRFGWWYDFDRNNKVIRISQMKESLSGEQKDFTEFTNPTFTKTILANKKVYSIKIGGDSSEINFSGVTLIGNLTAVTNLPAAAEALSNQVYLIVDENNYYICKLNDAGAWSWQLFSENTRSVVPVNATEDITTNCFIPTMTTSFRNNFLPQWDEGGYWSGLSQESDYTGSLVLAFYYGLRRDKTGSLYPFASHHIYDGQDMQVGTWSLSLKAKKIDGTEIGLYDINWKPALDKLSISEEIELMLYLPREKWLNLKWNDQITIEGVRLYIKTLKPVLPYKNILSLICIRI